MSKIDGTPAKQAAKALADLHIFAAVMALMESSLVSNACSTTESSIVQICKSEMQKCLVRYDRALAKEKP